MMLRYLPKVIATFVYALIGWAGYLMFGKDVSDEVSCHSHVDVVSCTSQY